MNKNQDEDHIPELRSSIAVTQKLVQQCAAEKENRNLENGKKEFLKVLS